VLEETQNPQGYPWNGTLRGGDRAMMEFLENYRGPEGIGLQVTLPVPDWDRYAYLITHLETWDAGRTASHSTYTVPDDSRAVLLAFRSFRVTGDNEIDSVHFVYPAAYQEGNEDESQLIAKGSTLDIFWPDSTGIQSTSATYMKGPTPILMEPGTQLVLTPSGAGVSVSTFQTLIDVLVCKIIRAQAPRAL